MKFTSLACATLAAGCSLSLVHGKDTAAQRGNQLDREPLQVFERKLMDSRSKKSDACPTCTEQLPGYSFFGQNYLDKSFWDDIAAAFFDGEPFPTDGQPPVPPEDFLVPLFPAATDGLTCYSNDATLFVCGIITFFSELIFQTDVLRCLLTSFVTTLRDLSCIDVPIRRRLLSEQQNDAFERILTEGGGGMDTPDFIMGGMAMLNVDSLDKLLEIFGADITNFPLYSRTRRSLFFDIRSGSQDATDILEDITGLDLDEVIENTLGDSDFVQALTGTLFFDKCNNIFGFPLALCAGIFGILKTLDATVCYYREELGCGDDTCTKELKFDVDYQAERLFIDLPIAPVAESLILADILAPCGECINEKSGGCAAFCNLYESYHTCDNIQAAYLASALPGDIVGSFFTTVSLTDLIIF